MCGCVVRTQYNTLHIHSLYPVLGSTSFMTMGCVIFGDFRFIRWFYGEIGLISLQFIHGIRTLRSLCDYVQNKPTILCGVSCRNIQMKYFSFWFSSSSSSYQDGKKKQLNIVRVITFFKWWFGFLNSLTQNIIFSFLWMTFPQRNVQLPLRTKPFSLQNTYVSPIYSLILYIHIHWMNDACCHCYLQYLLFFFTELMMCLFTKEYIKWDIVRLWHSTNLKFQLKSNDFMFSVFLFSFVLPSNPDKNVYILVGPIHCGSIT